MSEAKFNKAAEIIQSLPKDGPIKPTQDDQLYFYSHFKQATIGDVNTPRPGLLDFVGKAKWDAWKKLEGVSKEEARKEYVNKLVEVLKTADDADAKKFLEELEAIA
ncbi:acyl-CoA-binding protein [Irpex rosettiformis]|uniref:Acyl-CoA-binding protein n=1 Tax=Irpex rosettiformis TaxID=378272 RepID=A0ACB8U9M7_9APHY|nr:acyl-CoA-binding protein [Irpex rosettiformis]